MTILHIILEDTVRFHYVALAILCDLQFVEERPIGVGGPAELEGDYRARSHRRGEAFAAMVGIGNLMKAAGAREED